MASTTSAPPPGTESDWGATGGGGGGLQHGRPAPVSTFPAAVRPSQTGIGVALAAISMMFAALTSAMVVRQGAARDWGHFELPGILYFNTLILLLSSFSLELARRRFAQDPGLGREESHGNAGQSAQVLYWLYATMGLGLLFVFGQLVAWRELAAQGLFLATTSHKFIESCLGDLRGIKGFPLRDRLNGPQ